MERRGIQPADRPSCTELAVQRCCEPELLGDGYSMWRNDTQVHSLDMAERLIPDVYLEPVRSATYEIYDMTSICLSVPKLDRPQVCSRKSAISRRIYLD